MTPASRVSAAAHLGGEPREMLAVAGIDDVSSHRPIARTLTASHDDNPDGELHQALRDRAGPRPRSSSNTRTERCDRASAVASGSAARLLPERPVEPCRGVPCLVPGPGVPAKVRPSSCAARTGRSAAPRARVALPRWKPVPVDVGAGGPQRPEGVQAGTRCRAGSRRHPAATRRIAAPARRCRP